MRDVPFQTMSPFEHSDIKFNSYFNKCHAAGQIQAHRMSASELKGQALCDSITSARVVLHVIVLMQLSE